MKGLHGLRHGWAGMAPREQGLVAAAALLVLLAVVWSLGLAPALRVLRAAPAQIDALDAQLQAMQDQAAQARGMAGRPAVGRDETVRSLESSLRLTLGPGAQLRLTGDRATVTLKAATPEQLAQWLAQARVGARATVSQANLVRGENGWDGTLVLDLPPAA